MVAVKDTVFFALIHDFFKIYLPKQKNCSPHTIKSYKTALEALLDFVKVCKGVRLSDVTFEMIDRHMLTAFLDSIEAGGNSISTRNLRLNCIRAFYNYVAKMESAAVIYQDEIRKVPLKKSDRLDTVEYMSEVAVKALLAAPNVNAKLNPSQKLKRY